MGQGTVRVRLSGPTVTGRAPAMLQRMLRSALAETADYASYQVQITEEATFVNPTGYYTSRTTLQRVDPYAYRLHDGGVIYGPWLEGISPRNQTTRFKGYHIYRRTKDSIARRQRAIVEAHLARLARDL